MRRRMKRKMSCWMRRMMRRKKRMSFLQRSWKSLS